MRCAAAVTTTYHYNDGIPRLGYPSKYKPPCHVDLMRPIGDSEGCPEGV